MCIGIFSFRAFDRRLARLAAPISSGVRQGGRICPPPSGARSAEYPSGARVKPLSSRENYALHVLFLPEGARACPSRCLGLFDTIHLNGAKWTPPTPEVNLSAWVASSGPDPSPPASHWSAANPGPPAREWRALVASVPKLCVLRNLCLLNAFALSFNASTPHWQTIINVGKYQGLNEKFFCLNRNFVSQLRQTE